MIEKTPAEIKIIAIKDPNGTFCLKSFDNLMSIKVPNIRFEKNISLIVNEHNLISKEIKGVSAKIITDPSKRFSDIENWYIKTKRVWK